MALAWKIMLPLGLANLITVALLGEIRAWYDPAYGSQMWDLALAIPNWATCILGWLLVSNSGTLVTNNAPRRNLDPLEIDSQTG